MAQTAKRRRRPLRVDSERVVQDILSARQVLFLQAAVGDALFNRYRSFVERDSNG
jgi:hypothetical protein